VLLADLLDSIHDIEDFREIFITESDTKKVKSKLLRGTVEDSYRGMSFLQSLSGKSALDFCAESAR